MNQAKLQSSQSDTFAEAEGGHAALSHQLGRFCPHLHLHGIIDTVAWTSSVDAAQTLYSGKKWVQRTGVNIEPILFILLLQEHCFSQERCHLWLLRYLLLTNLRPAPHHQHSTSALGKLGSPRNTIRLQDVRVKFSRFDFSTTLRKEMIKRKTKSQSYKFLTQNYFFH